MRAQLVVGGLAVASGMSSEAMWPAMLNKYDDNLLVPERPSAFDQPAAQLKQFSLEDILEKLEAADADGDGVVSLADFEEREAAHMHALDAERTLSITIKVDSASVGTYGYDYGVTATFEGGGANVRLPATGTMRGVTSESQWAVAQDTTFALLAFELSTNDIDEPQEGRLMSITAGEIDLKVAYLFHTAADNSLAPKGKENLPKLTSRRGRSQLPGPEDWKAQTTHVVPDEAFRMTTKEQAEQLRDMLNWGVAVRTDHDLAPFYAFRVTGYYLEGAPADVHITVEPLLREDTIECENLQQLQVAAVRQADQTQAPAQPNLCKRARQSLRRKLKPDKQLAKDAFRKAQENKFLEKQNDAAMATWLSERATALLVVEDGGAPKHFRASAFKAVQDGGNYADLQHPGTTVVVKTMGGNKATLDWSDSEDLDHFVNSKVITAKGGGLPGDERDDGGPNTFYLHLFGTIIWSNAPGKPAEVDWKTWTRKQVFFENVLFSPEHAERALILMYHE